MSRYASDTTVSVEKSRMEIERTASAIEALSEAAEAVSRLAFSMPAPNQWTPQFIMIANEMRRRAYLALAKAAP